MAILVSNAVYSSGELCEGGCPSWRLHWENHVDMDAEKCSAIGCNGYEDLVGGHVYREDEDGDNEDCYIIPICKTHNHPDMEDYYVEDDTEFVPDDELRTCTTEYEDEEE